MPARPSAVVAFRVRILSRVKTVAIAMAFQLGLRTPPGRARGDGSEGTTMLQMRIIISMFSSISSRTATWPGWRIVNDPQIENWSYGKVLVVYAYTANIIGLSESRDTIWWHLMLVLFYLRFYFRSGRSSFDDAKEENNLLVIDILRAADISLFFPSGKGDSAAIGFLESVEYESTFLLPETHRSRIACCHSMADRAWVLNCGSAGCHIRQIGWVARIQRDYTQAEKKTEFARH
jgi:hypothetical protein